MSEYTKILIDKVDWDDMLFGPQYIIGKDSEFLKVYMGESQTEENNSIGVYIKDEDYHKIDHTKTYIFINNPIINSDDVNEVLKDITLENVEESNDADREHIHIGPLYYWTEDTTSPTIQ